MLANSVMKVGTEESAVLTNVVPYVTEVHVPVKTGTS